MNKLGLGQTIQILANAGVIVGLAFLALQLEQNNKLLAAQARVARHELRSTDSNRVLYDSPALAAALAKTEKGLQLSDDEGLLVDHYFAQTLLDWQFVYVEYQHGLLEQGELPVRGWKRVFAANPILRKHWQQSKDFDFRQDFVAWFDETVAR